LAATGKGNSGKHWAGGGSIYSDLDLIGQARGGQWYDSIGGLIAASPAVFKYSRRSAPFGFNGGHYYLRASFNF